MRKGRRHGTVPREGYPPWPWPQPPPTPNKYTTTARLGAGEKVRSPISKAGNVTSFTKPLGGKNERVNKQRKGGTFVVGSVIFWIFGSVQGGPPTIAMHEPPPKKWPFNLDHRLETP